MISLMTKSRTSLLPTDLLRPIVPTLIAGTMEKNSMVRSCSETALVDVLQLRKGPQGQSEVLVLLDTGAKESLVEITSKSLTKLATQPEDKSNVLDDTMLMWSKSKTLSSWLFLRIQFFNQWGMRKIFSFSEELSFFFLIADYQQQSNTWWVCWVCARLVSYKRKYVYITHNFCTSLHNFRRRSCIYFVSTY